MKIEDFNSKGHEKIVEKGVIMDGNVTWSIHDDLGKHRKETQQMVEEHLTYRVLAISTTVGIIFPSYLSLQSSSSVFITETRQQILTNTLNN